MIDKDNETLRREILDKLNTTTVPWKPWTIPKIDKCLLGYKGNTLKVLHCLIHGIPKGKDIAETVGISGAAVSKIINNKFEDIKRYLYLVTGAMKYGPKKEIRKFPRSKKKFDPDTLMSPQAAALAEAQVRDLIYGDSDQEEIESKKLKPSGFYINSLKELKTWGRGGWDVGRTNPLPHELVRKGRGDDYIRDELQKYWKTLKKDKEK